jgi:hypothetical protein
MAEGMTLRKATAELHVSHSNLMKWTAKGIGDIDSLDKILKSKRKTTHKGPLGQLKSMEDALLRYIFELHEQGINVYMFTVVLRALFLSPKISAKSFALHCSAVKRFMVAHLFTCRMGMHTSQRVPAKVKSKAFDFMLFMRCIVFGANRNWRFVINMDQTPVYFSMNAKRTLELIEKKQSTLALRRTTQSG